MAKILLMDKDEANLKLMKDALGILGTEDENASYQSENVHCLVIPDPIPPDQVPKGKTLDPYDHVYKALNEKPFDYIFLEALQVQGNPQKYVEAFRKKITFEQNKDVRFVLLSHNDDIDFIRKMVISGLFTDYILKPIDPVLFRQKVSLLVSKNATYKKELYSLPTDQPVNVAFNFVIADISEFGLTLKSNRPYQAGEFVTFYSPVFKTDKKAEVIGRCYKCESTGTTTTEFHSKFVFVGVGDSVRKQIRNWMKLEYVRKKQAA